MCDTPKKVNISLLSVDETSKMPQEFAQRHFPVRMERAKRFRFSLDRLRSIGAGILLFSVAGLDEKDIETDRFGKPFNRCNTKKFSISHGGQYSVLAVCDGEVGVDIEPTGDHRTIADRVLTAEELAFVGEDCSRFLRLWTLKETVSKLIGKGLSLDFRSFSVLTMLHGDGIMVENRLIFGSTVELPGHVLSYATENHALDAEIHCLTESEIDFSL